jgi:hypothetical protein
MTIEQREQQSLFLKKRLMSEAEQSGECTEGACSQRDDVSTELQTLL